MEQILRCVECLQSTEFTVKSCGAIITQAIFLLMENYSRLILKTTVICRYICITENRIYLVIDSVYLMKNVRNNLLSPKKFTFSCGALKDFPISIEGGEVTWASLHNVYEKDLQCQASLRTAPKITARILHPGSRKQSVPVALAVFDPSTITAVRNYFPEDEDREGFRHQIYVWWTISNFKLQYNSRDKPGNPVVKGDGKPEFLRSVAYWVEMLKTSLYQRKPVQPCAKQCDAKQH